MLVGKRAAIKTFGNRTQPCYATPLPLLRNPKLIPPILLSPRKEFPRNSPLWAASSYTSPSPPRGGQGGRRRRRRQVYLASISFCGTECLLACQFAQSWGLGGGSYLQPGTRCILIMYGIGFRYRFETKNNCLSRCMYILSVQSRDGSSFVVACRVDISWMCKASTEVLSSLALGALNFRKEMSDCAYNACLEANEGMITCY